VQLDATFFARAGSTFMGSGSVWIAINLGKHSRLLSLGYLYGSPLGAWLVGLPRSLYE
jgi:hypothetical protein